MKHRPPIWFAAICLLTVGAVASSPRDARSASVYSMVLIGERLEAGDVRAITLGGSGNVIPDTMSVMHYNQALLAHLTRVTIGASQFIGFDQATSDEFSEQDNSFAITTLQAAFPIYDKLVLSVGYRGRYDPDGQFSLRETAPSGDAYTSTFVSSGGIFSIPLTASAKFTRFLSLAGTFSVERGFVEERWDIVFDDPSFNPGASIKREELSGFGWGAAAVLRPAKWLMLGGTFESQIDYDTEVTTRFTQPGIDTTYNSTMVLPARFTGGVTLMVGGWMLLGQGFYSNFEDFEGLAFDRTRLRPEWDASVGIEWTSGMPLRGARIPLRFSVAVGQRPFDFPREPGMDEGEPVNKLLFGIGTGMNIRGGKGKLDLGVQFGQMGDLETNGLQDRIFRVYIGVAGGEEWKRKAAGSKLVLVTPTHTTA